MNTRIVNLKKKHKNKMIHFFILLGLVLFWSAILHFFKPGEIVDAFGVTNTYLIIFFVALLVGVSSFTAISYFAAVATFAAGGADIIPLAISAGIGLTIADSIFYVLGKKALAALGSKVKKRIHFVSRWLNKKPKYMVQLFAFIYAGFTPLPGDLMLLSFGLSKYPFRWILPAIFLGNIALALIISTLSSSGLGVEFIKLPDWFANAVAWSALIFVLILLHALVNLASSKRRKNRT